MFPSTYSRNRTVAISRLVSTSFSRIKISILDTLTCDQWWTPRFPDISVNISSVTNTVISKLAKNLLSYIDKHRCWVDRSLVTMMAYLHYINSCHFRGFMNSWNESDIVNDSMWMQAADNPSVKRSSAQANRRLHYCIQMYDVRKKDCIIESPENI